MAILKNDTQKGYTIVSNTVLRDKSLSLKDRGLMCTLIGLPDGWEFSIAGLSSTVLDGKDSITKSFKRLEKRNYIRRSKIRGPDGRFRSLIVLFPESNSDTDGDISENHSGKTMAENPPRRNRYGKSVTDKPAQYNTYNSKTYNQNSIIPSVHQEDGRKKEDAQAYRELIADNIDLDMLQTIAHEQGETQIVREIYDLICDMVCIPRKEVMIEKVPYPWEVVKAQFLKLDYKEVSSVLNVILDKDLQIRNMKGYLTTALYNASLGGTVKHDGAIHDDYLKAMRGKPYGA